jgi:hypothetical protein
MVFIAGKTDVGVVRQQTAEILSGFDASSDI